LKLALLAVTETGNLLLELLLIRHYKEQDSSILGCYAALTGK
jgi:hypothetical protein